MSDTEQALKIVITIIPIPLILQLKQLLGTTAIFFLTVRGVIIQWYSFFPPVFSSQF